MGSLVLILVRVVLETLRPLAQWVEKGIWRTVGCGWVGLWILSNEWLAARPCTPTSLCSSFPLRSRSRHRCGQKSPAGLRPPQELLARHLPSQGQAEPAAAGGQDPLARMRVALLGAMRLGEGLHARLLPALPLDTIQREMQVPQPWGHV
jgi:hypothetical protein